MKLIIVFVFIINCFACANSDNSTTTENVTESKLTTTTSKTTTIEQKLPATTQSTASSFFGNTLMNIRNFFFNPAGDRRQISDGKNVKNFTATTKPTTTRKPNSVEAVTEKLEKERNATITKRMNQDDVELVHVDQLMCPTEREAKFDLFPTICNSNQDCYKLGGHFRCCKLFGGKRCHLGVEKPLEDIQHEPLFGIPRKCPDNPLAESFWDVQPCFLDKDCSFPRICCPSGRKRYCMNAQVEPEMLPVARQLAYPVESFSQYFQCTPAPPTAFDSYPKPCNSSLQCFPNVCCLEGGKKHCRPPKKNILSALTTFTQRFDFIRDFTNNLVIRR